MNRRNLLALAVLLAVTSTLIITSAEAQFRAGLQGAVTDATGAVVPGAKVTLTNRETGASRTATTTNSGLYSIPSLPPGAYRLSVEKEGFQKKVLENISITGDQLQGANVQLDVGQAAQTVTVTADATPSIQTETATISGTLQQRDIARLPSFNRDVYQLLQLAPGAFGDGARSGSGNSADMPATEIGGSGGNDAIFKTENGGHVVANGTRSNANNYQIDGVGVTSVSWGGTAVITPNEESVKEVKVVTNSYDAENGRFSGAQVKVISNNGTNQYHGSIFIKADRPGLNAFQRWGGPQGQAPTRNTNRFNQIGGSVGGPIIKNRLFGFFSYETIRNNSTGTASGWYDTPQFDGMAPAGSIAQKFLTFPGNGVKFSSIAPATCGSIGLVEGVNCRTIAGQGLDLGSPLTTPLGTQDPTYVSPNNPGVGSGLDGVPDMFLVNTVNPTTNKEQQFNARVDFQATANDLLAVSMYRVPIANTSFNGPNRPMNFFHHNATNEAETFLWNHTFSPTLLNEARVNAAGWRWNELADNPQEPYGLPTDNIKPNNNAATAIGSVVPQNFGAQGLSIFDQWTYNVKDTLTKVHNSHTLKFGGEVTRLTFLDEAPWNARPNYFFNNMWDFLNDAPVQEQGAFDPRTGVPTDFRKDTRSNIYGFFAQDDWKVRPNLTLNLGLRWEYFGPISEKKNNLSSVVLGSGANLLTGIKMRLGGNLYEASKTNFGPQLGFAWSPAKYNDRVVFRGGFGIGYNGLEEAITLNGRSNPPFLSFAPTLTSADGNIVYGIPADVHSIHGYPSNPATIAIFDPTTNLPTGTTQVGVTGFPAHLPTSYTYRYSLDMQYDMGHQWVATLGYQGSSSRHLTRQYNLNQVWGSFIPMNPNVNNVDFYANDANSNFNALLGEVRHRFSRSFELDGQYRWSKSMDDGSNNFAVDQFQWNPAFAWGPSDYDVTHAFKLWGVWAPTIFRGNNSWLEKIAGGWTLSGILNAHSGFPWTPYFGGGCDVIYAGAGGQSGSTCNLRPAAYLGGAGNDYSNSTFMRTGGNFPNGGLAYFTPPAFVSGPSFTDIVTGVAAPGPIPQAPLVKRNSLRGPHYFDVDMTLTKSFGLPTLPVLGENAKFEFRANFYNIFNKLNLAPLAQTSADCNGAPDPRVVDSAAFGQAQCALGGRTIELQARFAF